MENFFDLMLLILFLGISVIILPTLYLQYGQPIVSDNVYDKSTVTMDTLVPQIQSVEMDNRSLMLALYLADKNQPGTQILRIESRNSLGNHNRVIDFSQYDGNYKSNAISAIYTKANNSDYCGVGDASMTGHIITKRYGQAGNNGQLGWIYHIE